jgi:transmembrane sensor
MHPDPVETGISDEAIEWFSKLRSGLATPEDHARFEAWVRADPLHAKAYTDVEKFWALLDEPAQRVFERENAAAGQEVPRPAKSRRRFFAALALAAMVAALPYAADALRFWTSDHHTRRGERREIALQDGSRITLNTHSALTVEFSPRQRVIELLEGEAYFQVAHDPDRPFIVATGHGSARVTGTAFDVYEQDERMTVTVSEGRVRVYAEGAEDRAVELTAGLQASGNRNGIGPALRVDARQVSAWRSGLLTFDMRPLAAVIEELNRYLPDRIVIVDSRIRERVVSGTFDLSRPRDVLAAIEDTLKLGSLKLPGPLILLYQPR